MKSILLIGLGRFGRHIAQELNELGHQVMAIDSNEDRAKFVRFLYNKIMRPSSTPWRSRKASRTSAA